MIRYYKETTGTDLGANVYDLNNPSYTENVISTTNLNTSLLGVQNITYSALADTAGTAHTLSRISCSICICCIRIVVDRAN